MIEDPTSIKTIPDSIEAPVQTPLIMSVRNHISELRQTVQDTHISMEPRHVNLVEAFADRIMAMEPEAVDANHEVVILSVLLHNIGKIRSTPVRSNPQHASAIDAKKILDDIGAAKKTRVKVGDCIDNQSSRPLPKGIKDKSTIETRVLSAAISASRIAQAQSLVNSRDLNPSERQILFISLRGYYARLGYFPRLLERFKVVFENLASKLNTEIAKS